jgi:hypothetical protein
MRRSSGGHTAPRRHVRPARGALLAVLGLVLAAWSLPAAAAARPHHARCAAMGGHHAGGRRKHGTRAGRAARAGRADRRAGRARSSAAARHAADPRRRPGPRKPRGGTRPHCTAKPTLGLYASRTLEAYAAMQRYFYSSSSGRYRDTPQASESSDLWPFSQGLTATVSVASIPGELARLQGVMSAQLRGLGGYLTTAVPVAVASTEALQSLPHYEATVASTGAGETAFYDDNDWVGLALVRMYALTHDEVTLALAEQIMSFEMAGWSNEPGEICPGGIPHSDMPPDDQNRSTISTAPAAELAVELYRITHETSYLQFAQTAYAWVRGCLLGPEGLYADHIEETGEIDPETWSYNQGVMIGAGALLFQATGVQSYLEQASLLAKQALAAFPLSQLAAENPFFASVFLRNLLYLDSILHEESGRKLAQEYVAWAWESLLEKNGLVLSASGAPSELLGQSAIVQICALLAIPPSSYF